MSSRMCKDATFIKIMSNNSSEELDLPDEFAMKYRHIIPPQIRMRIDDNLEYSWKVKIKANDGCSSFSTGWPDFVRESGLNESDFLSFSLENDSNTFRVTIYGNHGVKKSLVSLPSKYVEFFSDSGESDGDDGWESDDDDEVDTENKKHYKSWLVSDFLVVFFVNDSSKTFYVHLVVIITLPPVVAITLPAIGKKLHICSLKTIPKNFAENSPRDELNNKQGKEWLVKVSTRKNDGQVGFKGVRTSDWREFWEDNKLDRRMGAALRFTFDSKDSGTLLVEVKKKKGKSLKLV
ncbi:hypothetical protein CASFOL_029035 [Castilleja foliolosa]|uniref:TF-B3 domain-containing protein n=1 Tax=Castilleja foliolosa TaxID=1961234 RepID=A0ABD3CDR1_9LAMI